MPGQPEESLTFAAELWEHAGEGGWHFVTLPVELAEDIRSRTGHVARGFGSVRVTARLGRTTWTTSVFPSSADSSYVLPVKKQVRRAEDVMAGDRVRVELVLLDV